jgi:hypothetical protein
VLVLREVDKKCGVIRGRDIILRLEVEQSVHERGAMVQLDLPR